MQSEILGKLNHIESLAPDPYKGLDKGACELMDKYGQDISSLGILVERYGSSPSTMIVRCLAFTIATKAQSPIHGLFHLTMTLIEKLRYDDPETLINICTGLRAQFRFPVNKEEITHGASTLCTFIVSCLNYVGRLTEIVREDGFWLLSILQSSELIDEIFNSSQIAMLTESTKRVKEEYPCLEPDISELISFLVKTREIA